MTGQTVTAFVDYADLGVESGETIRLLAREAASPPFEGFFPMVLLTLK